MANRGSAKLNDGSLSDTQTYAEVKPEYNTYAMWLKHNGQAANRLSEGDSLESVSIVSSPGLSRNSKLMQQSRESAAASSQQAGQNAKLNRSNSIRYVSLCGSCFKKNLFQSPFFVVFWMKFREKNFFFNSKTIREIKFLNIFPYFFLLWILSIICL